MTPPSPPTETNADPQPTPTPPPPQSNPEEGGQPSGVAPEQATPNKLLPGGQTVDIQNPLRVTGVDVVLTMALLFYNNNPAFRAMSENLGLGITKTDIEYSQRRLLALGVLKNKNWELDKEKVIQFFAGTVPFLWPKAKKTSTFEGPFPHKAMDAMINRENGMYNKYMYIVDAVNYLRMYAFSGKYHKDAVENIESYLDAIDMDEAAKERKANHSPKAKRDNLELLPKEE